MSFRRWEYNYNETDDEIDGPETPEEGIELPIHTKPTTDAGSVTDPDPIVHSDSVEGTEPITNTNPTTDLSPAPAADPVPITDIGLWSELAKYITAFTPIALDEVGIDREVRIQLKCEICLDKDLRLPHWVSGCSKIDRRSSEDICVLPCGHFFGKKCMMEWTKQSDYIQSPVCPKCRFPLVHPKCKHKIHIKIVRASDLYVHMPNCVAHYVPFTRVHQLDPDNEGAFVDISEWDPEQADAQHNFGISAECYECEKQRMIEEWEKRRGDAIRW
ncbi:hypothetical protein F5Y10DRAFT_293965 [Nemania abortiva]|nr:hypothetical protein F5Y10DRAFT_293965 [Nemania abortiva]